MKNFGIYGIITKPKLSYDTVAEIFAEEEIAYVQLREKHLCDRLLLIIARNLKQIFKNTKTRFIINDRIDIALLAEADGVHLGQEDIAYNDARKLLGNEKIIGLSTHNLNQLIEALSYNPDYVGFGPIYATTTKEKPDPVVGTSLLSEALSIATVPVVAIGGIFPENIDEVLKAGAKNICMVRYFMESKTKNELRERIKMVKLKLQEYDTDAICH